jgi:hypothetical protein
MVARFVDVSKMIFDASQSIAKADLRALATDEQRWLAVEAALGPQVATLARQFVSNFHYHHELLLTSGFAALPDDVLTFGSDQQSGDFVFPVEHHELLQAPTVRSIADHMITHLGLD